MSTKVTMASYPLTSGRFVMKSIEMYSHGRFGTGKGRLSPYLGVVRTFILSHVEQICNIYEQFLTFEESRKPSKYLLEFGYDWNVH